MKRRPPVMLILLLLVAIVGGAIVNVAVAWGFSIWPIRPNGSNQQVTASIEDFEPFVDAGWRPSNTSWDGYRLFKSEYTAWGAHWTHCIEHMGFKPQSPAETATIVIVSQISQSNDVGIAIGAGWPCHSLSGCVFSRQWDDDGKLISPDTPSGVIMFSSSQAMLPLRPIWPGFAINTVFYAFILWLLFAVPFALRRRRRIKRGLCPKCAYPVGTNAVCTECGAAVTNRFDAREGTRHVPAAWKAS